MQTCINGTYEEERREGKARAFIDDLGLTTGRAGDPKVPNPLDTLNPEAVKAFEEHLVLMGVVLMKAVEDGYKFKLIKAYFAQLVIRALGFLAGQGVKSVDPNKTSTIVNCPRPVRLGDPDSFLGGASWLRGHCASEFSEATRPLRALTKVRLEKEGYKGSAGQAKLKGLPQAEEVLQPRRSQC